MKIGALAVMAVLVGFSSSASVAEDTTGQVWVLSVDKPGSLTTDSTTIKNGDTISYAVFAPVKDASVDGQVVCTAGSKYDAWLLNQTSKDGKIVTQTFLVWDSKNDGKLWDMGKSKISVVSAVDANGKASCRSQTPLRVPGIPDSTCTNENISNPSLSAARYPDERHFARGCSRAPECSVYHGRRPHDSGHWRLRKSSRPAESDASDDAADHGDVGDGP